MDARRHLSWSRPERMDTITTGTIIMGTLTKADRR